MDYQELIERLRYEGYDVSRNEAANAIESLLVENERLKAELAKYRDAPVVVWRTRPYDYGIGHKGIYASTHSKEQSEAWKRNGWRVVPLIVKPGENK